MTEAGATNPGSSPRREPIRRNAIRALQVLLAAGIVAYLIYSGQLDPRALGAAARRWPWWLAAVIACGGSLGAVTLRWHLFLRFHRVEVSLREAGQLVLIGFCFNQVTPGSTGGDIAKAIALTRAQRERRTAALFSIAADRATGLVSLMLIACAAAAAGLPIVRSHAPLALFASGAAAALTLLALGFAAIRCFPLRRIGLWRRAALRARRIGWIDELAQLLARHSHNPAHWLAPLGVSILSQTLLVATVLLSARALLGPEVDLRGALVVVPIALLASGIPLTPFGNAGVLEALFAELFSYAAIGQGALIGLVLRSVFWFWALVGAAALACQRAGTRSPALAPQEEG